MTTDFEINRLGILSPQQQRFLCYQLIFRLVVIGFIGIPLALSLIQLHSVTPGEISYNVIGWVILFVVLAITATFLWTYGRDLLVNKPLYIVGRLIKYRKRRLRGPDKYCLKIDKHQFFNVEILTTADVWSSMQENQQYELFFARGTKWLLSWQKLQT